MFEFLLAQKLDAANLMRRTTGRNPQLSTIKYTWPRQLQRLNAKRYQLLSVIIFLPACTLHDLHRSAVLH